MLAGYLGLFLAAFGAATLLPLNDIRPGLRITNYRKRAVKGSHSRPGPQDSRSA
jgi:hypothetical protein